MDSAGTFSTTSSQSRSLFRGNGSPSSVPQHPRMSLIGNDETTGGQGTSSDIHANATPSTTCDCGKPILTFFTPRESSCQSEAQDKGPTPGRLQLIESAVKQNASLVALLDTFLSCECSEDGDLFIIAALMAYKLVDLLAKVTHPADDNREREDSTLEVTDLSPQDAGASGDEDKSRVAMYKLVGQTYGLQRRVGSLHEKIKAVAGDNTDMQGDHRKATAKTCRLP
ncbi:hypothetical protein PRZ48_012079 [Zasmidium cellare]|uniref:Aflatoxin regulatory protein domain-containing protein n=1 Tax=Zasmidium cellare TaxID=395010 RepID=A0ABR0E3V3_ZASCE|nr:hypothetical protein PRZ48_012079 [Zasmidium cellare]